MNRLKQILFLAGSVCWLLFGAGFILLLVPFFRDGAGMQLFGASEFSVSPGTVLGGLVYLTGMVTASLICFAVSFYLFERSRPALETHEKEIDLP